VGEASNVQKVHNLFRTLLLFMLRDIASVVRGYFAPVA
jgi:hypothetical protein